MEIGVSLPILGLTIGDVPKLVRGGSAKALFISSSLIVASRDLRKGVFFYAYGAFLAFLEAVKGVFVLFSQNFSKFRKKI